MRSNSAWDLRFDRKPAAANVTDCTSSCRCIQATSSGLTHVKKIAALAESYHSALATHNFLGPITTGAAIQVDASIPNFVTQEYSLRDEHPANAVFVNQYKREGGYMLLSDAPGIGIEIDEDLLKVAKTTYETRDLNMIPMRVDGSVGYSV